MTGHAQPHRHQLHAEDELTRVLNEARTDKRPVILETPDARYQVIRETETVNLTDDPWANYDPQKALQAVEQSAGILKESGVDVAQLLRDIAEDRTQNSTGRPAE